MYYELLIWFIFTLLVSNLSIISMILLERKPNLKTIRNKPIKSHINIDTISVLPIMDTVKFSIESKPIQSIIPIKPMSIIPYNRQYSLIPYKSVLPLATIQYKPMAIIPYKPIESTIDIVSIPEIIDMLHNIDSELVLVQLQTVYGIEVANDLINRAYLELNQSNLDDIEINNDDYDNNDDYNDYIRESLNEIKSLPLYNYMVTLPNNNRITKHNKNHKVIEGELKSKNYNIKRRLINLITDDYGSVLEAITPHIFKVITGDTPQESIIQTQNVYKDNQYAGRINTYYAVDSISTELGYNSSQELLDDVERIKSVIIKANKMGVR